MLPFRSKTLVSCIRACLLFPRNCDVIHVKGLSINYVTLFRPLFDSPLLSHFYKHLPHVLHAYYHCCYNSPTPISPFDRDIVYGRPLALFLSFRFAPCAVIFSRIYFSNAPKRFERLTLRIECRFCI